VPPRRSERHDSVGSVLLACLVGVCLVSSGHALTPPSVSDIGDGAAASSQDLLDRAADIFLPLALRLDNPQTGYPRSITYGSDWRLDAPSNWTSGFFPGILWQLYERTGAPELLSEAVRWTEGLSDETTLPTHDVGFIIYSSFGQGYRLTGDPAYRDVLLEAAEHLATRYDPNVGAIRSWGPMRHFEYPVAIDGMMNLQLLFWAAENGGDPALKDIAIEHARTTRSDHVRPDGSTWHVVEYDDIYGEVLEKGTLQGYADTSMWARGQAWAIYGFTVVTRETGDAGFRWTAEKVADAFLDRLPPDGVPLWDFDAPPDHPKDASAAAVAASGLWDLSMLASTPEKARRYRAASYALVERLSGGDYSAEGVGLPALLLHSTGNMPAQREVDAPIIYAEYYFIEALSRQRPGQATPCRPALGGRPAVEDRLHPKRPSAAGDRGRQESRADDGLWLRTASNPFTCFSVLRYHVPSPSTVTLTVFDPSGRRVRRLVGRAPVGAGERSVVWDGKDDNGRSAAAGVYLLRLEAGEDSAARKLVLLR